MASRGKIKKLVLDRGFGFIYSGVKGKDVFFHATVVTGTEFELLADGQEVEYEVAPDAGNEKGPRASLVRLP